jgi:ketosteroid isomerase-like protein
MSLSGTSVSFEAMEGGGDPTEQTIMVTVTGEATPYVGETQYEGGGGGWLRADLGPREGDRTPLTLSASAGSLTEGSYTARVPVSAGENTQVVEARITIAPDPNAGPVEPNPAAERDITALLGAYASAINNKDVEGVLAIFPSGSRAGLERVFENTEDTDVTLFQLVPGTLRIGDQEGTLEADVITSTLAGGDQSRARQLIYTFGRGDQGWYIVSQRPGG